jgi:murein DD-endopeptidase MepM/ murein hydrolase activator NlpD
MKITRRQLRQIIKEELKLSIQETDLPNTKSYPAGPDGEVIERTWSYDIHPIAGKGANIKKLITQDFKAGGSHKGIDYGHVKIGTDILAIADGTVKKVYNDEHNGFGLDITHDKVDGVEYSSQYIHMEKLPTLTSNDSVKAGQVIGFVGNTGTSTGQHLHFQVKQLPKDAKFPVAVDPKLFYKTV